MIEKVHALRYNIVTAIKLNDNDNGNNIPLWQQQRKTKENRKE